MPGTLEWIGYLASLIILISLLMSSVKRLRWINLFGATIFAVYGFLIHAIPVGLMNVGIVMINIYYLVQMYAKKDYFTLLKLGSQTEYFNHFMSFYKENIQSFMDVEKDLDNPQYVKLFILRNTVPAGIVVSKIKNPTTLEIVIDYVIPAYRDFKIGNFLYENQKDFFISQGFEKLVTKPGNEKHQSYLKKMGFIPETIDGEYYYLKNLNK
ncbi:MAG: YgjV family protein [Firmicutes bacterium]|nr:YgjV family protein [Bacillota bacterium]